MKSPASASPQLTVLTMIWNEADALVSYFERLDPAISAVVKDYELLMIDGGSSDGSIELAKKAGARVIRQSRPGYANAYREGLRLATGRWILTVDADGSHPMEMLDELWRRRQDASVVMGSRYLAGSSDLRPFKRRFLSLILNKMLASALGCPLTDISGGFRLYRAEDVREIPCVARTYDAVAEIIVRLWGQGRKVLEIPYSYTPRENGESKARIIPFGISYLRTIVRLWWWLKTKKVS